MSRNLVIETRDGLRLDALAQGPAHTPPLVMLHGLSDSRLSFDPLLRQLPADLHAVALSQRGHGVSGKPEDPAAYSAVAFADDVAATLDAIGHQAGWVLGHSLGAWSALHAGARYPGRIRGLLLIGAFAKSADNAALRELSADVAGLSDPIDAGFVRTFQKAASADDLPPPFFETVVTEALRLPAPVWRSVLGAFLRDIVPLRLGAISAPALLIWGDGDPFVPRADQDALLEALAGSTLDVFEGLGHAPHWDRPDLVAQTIMQFLARQTQST